jgi:Zn-dependent protease
MPTRKGAFKIFSLFGIDVYIHWSWLIAFWLFSDHDSYSSFIWGALEVLALFAIVLTHEFGHQLACRQVGGQTHDIVLWPLGGVAYVSPPQRAGAQLWSIAAGPLVNVMLIPIFSIFVSLSAHLGWNDSHRDTYDFIHDIWFLNVRLLMFNMLPIYPLDGGQILRSLLWFIFGRVNSLIIAIIIGFVSLAGAISVIILFFPNWWNDPTGRIWLAVMGGFILLNCWSGLKHALALRRVAKIPRRAGFACPACKTAPPLGELWRCGKCGGSFDTFATLGVCPHCQTQFAATQCLDCATSSPIQQWSVPPPLP